MLISTSVEIRKRQDRAEEEGAVPQRGFVEGAAEYSISLLRDLRLYELFMRRSHSTRECARRGMPARQKPLNLGFQSDTKPQTFDLRLGGTRNGAM